MNGWHVETYGGGRYTAVAWYALRDHAERDAARRQWRGMPPRVTPGRDMTPKPRETPGQRVARILETAQALGIYFDTSQRSHLVGAFGHEQERGKP